MIPNGNSSMHKARDFFIMWAYIFYCVCVHCGSTYHKFITFNANPYLIAWILYWNNSVIVSEMWLAVFTLQYFIYVCAHSMQYRFIVIFSTFALSSLYFIKYAVITLHGNNGIRMVEWMNVWMDEWMEECGERGMENVGYCIQFSTG